MNFRVLSAQEVDALWPEVGKGLGVSLKRSGGDMTLGQLYQQCVSMSARVMIAHDENDVTGAAVFRPEVWETGPKLRCLAMYARNYLPWRYEAEAAMFRLKELVGANAIIFEGRKGHERLFPQARVLRQLYEVK